MHHQPQHSPLATALLDQALTYLVRSVVLCVRVVLCLAFCFEFNVDPWSRSASTIDASKLCGFETGAATDMFDLIGVVERWDELCALLNQLLPVPVGSH